MWGRGSISLWSIVPGCLIFIPIALKDIFGYPKGVLLVFPERIEFKHKYFSFLDEEYELGCCKKTVLTGGTLFLTGKYGEERRLENSAWIIEDPKNPGKTVADCIEQYIPLIRRSTSQNIIERLRYERTGDVIELNNAAKHSLCIGFGVTILAIALVTLHGGAITLEAGYIWPWAFFLTLPVVVSFTIYLFSNKTPVVCALVILAMNSIVTLWLMHSALTLFQIHTGESRIHSFNLRSARAKEQVWIAENSDALRFSVFLEDEKQYKFEERGKLVDLPVVESWTGSRYISGASVDSYLFTTAKHR